MAPRFSSDPTVDPSPLARPLQFTYSGRVAPNRLLKSATTERLSSWDRHNLPASGVPSTALHNIYRRWGEGGYGVLCTGNVMVCEDHWEAAGNMSVPAAARAEAGDQRFEAYRELARLGKKHGSLIVAQVNHPGRQARKEIQPHPVSASAIKLEDTLGMTFGQPHAATKEEVKMLISRYVDVSHYLYQAGFDGVQLHVAHGYLLAQFLSGTTNQRTDEYGGSLLNRARMMMEIIEGIRSKVSKDFIICMKLNSVEFQEGGFSAEEARELCSILEQQSRLDFVELSGGTYQSLAFEHKRESTKKREAFFLEFAEKIAPSLHETKTYLTGGFLTTSGMVNALDAVDGVGIARAACQEFSFGKDILEGKISGAIEQKIDLLNFMLTNVVAGTHIQQVGHGAEPIDLSVQENVDLFLREMQGWVEKVKDDKEMVMQGYVDLRNVNVAATAS